MDTLTVNIKKVLEQKAEGPLWLLRKIYEDLRSRKLIDENTDIYEEANKQKSNFINALNGNRPLNKLFYAPIERILGVSIADLSDENFKTRVFLNRGIRYTASRDDYQGYLDLFREQGDDPHLKTEVWQNYDEYGRNLLDYIIEYKSLEGLRALHYEKEAKVNYWDNRNLNILLSGRDQSDDILKLICFHDSAEMFQAYFDIYQSFIECSNIRDWLGVLGEEENLALVLRSPNILKSILSHQEYKISDLNNRMAQVKNDFVVKLANPYIQPLLAYALAHCDRFLSEAKQIVHYGIDYNWQIKKDFESHPELAYCRINEKGTILDGLTIYGNIITYKTETQTNYDHQLETLLRMLNDSINDLQFLDKPQVEGLSSKAVRVENGNLLKTHSDNKEEFEFLEKAAQYNLPFIPKVINIGEKYDTFTYFPGQSFTYSQDIPMPIIQQVMEAIKKKDEISREMLGDGKVYVHGDLSPRNIIFNQGKLIGIIDWDSTHIGEESEDLIYAIWQWINIGYINRNSNELYDRFKQVLGFYAPSKELKANFADKMIAVMDKALLGTPKDSPNYQRVFEWVGWSKIWVELFRDQITKDIG